MFSKFRNKKWRSFSRNQPCVKCGSTATTVCAHYSGALRNQLGGGSGVKVTDAAIQDLCYTCHSALDEKREQASDSEQLVMIIKTLNRRLLAIENGDLKI